jgi:L-threonylcarbamoyladenylate synthase
METGLQREVRAKLFTPSNTTLEECGERIRQGRLVAFPTETVYGLGADATNEEAVKSIFAAKERPFTDPVIVHVCSIPMALKCLKESKERDFIGKVGDILWPGPLTMIGPVEESYIPLLVGSGTGSVGVRFPAHKLAQELIRVSDRPIAAPSANKFMHVSPTKGSHVYDDLKFEDVAILDGEMSELGVESTVIKIDYAGPHYKVTLLRTGTYDFSEVQSKIQSMPDYANTEFIVLKKKVTNTEHDVAVAPGQLLKHYSPYVQAFLISRITSEEARQKSLILMEADMQTLGVIDFAGHNKELQNKVKLYTDLDSSGDYKVAMKRLYDELRNAEQKEHGLKSILLVNLQKILPERELALNTLADKTFRSAAGVEIYYDENQSFYSKPS